MSHDPLCPGKDRGDTRRCRCGLIRRVQINERARIRAGVEALPTVEGETDMVDVHKVAAVIDAAPQDEKGDTND